MSETAEPFPDTEARPLLVLSTAPDEASARKLARGLLEAHLAACVNLLPAVQSMYWWQGQLQEASEWLLLIKTTSARFSDLQARLREIHPYEVPECIALDISAGLPDYLRWLSQETDKRLPR